MSIPCLVNLVLGLVLAYYAWSIFMDTKTGDALVDRVRKLGQGVFGEDWHVHQYIVAGLLTLGALFFLAMAFSIFAAKHDFWVLKWL